MSFQRRHIQLRVSVEVVFKQGLVDEWVLHLGWEYTQSDHSLCAWAHLNIFRWLQAGYFTRIIHLLAQVLVLCHVADKLDKRELVTSPTHICLNELWALLSYLRDEPKHVNFLLRLHHVDHGIYYDEGSCPPNTSTAGTQNNPQLTLACQ